MKERLDYRKLVKGWMQFYEIPAAISRKMFASIWIRVQDSKLRAGSKGEIPNDAYMERTGRKSEEQ